ncbi:MAG: hypothetical protein IPF73_12615 [Betaproteobacteria bacterium]|nr:hypothetical protein [Betaproteobacteria bacterium]
MPGVVKKRQTGTVPVVGPFQALNARLVRRNAKLYAPPSRPVISSVSAVMK